MTLLDRFQGTIVGLAIGDALGAPTEFLHSMDEIRSRFGPLGVTNFERGHHPAGTYTDDTQMSIAVARALIEAGHEPLDTLMAVMAREFVEWSQSPDNNRAPGITCMTGCRNLGSGIPWREAGVAGSKGCGSAMRTAPIGLYYCENEATLIEVACASSRLTHGHPTALAAAAATALLVCWALRRDEPSEYAQRLVEVMSSLEGGNEVAELVRRVPGLLDNAPDSVLCRGVLGESWTGDEAVASALYCFCRSPEDYRQTVLTGANTVGDSDSIACIAGAVIGAYNGLHAIPESWRSTVETAPYLHEIAANLYEARCRQCE